MVHALVDANLERCQENMIRTVIVDDHHLVRRGLRMLLNQASDLQVVGEAIDGEEALRVVEAMKPDVVVMDVDMPLMNGFEATRLIRTRHKATQVVMLSMHTDPALVRQALENGAKSYILKQAMAQDLMEAIRSACRGITYLSKAVEQAVLIGSELDRRETNPLSPRENEVLRLIAEGQTNPQIAQNLNISLKTVEKHRINLMAKLEVHSLPELIRIGIKRGLIS